VPLTNAAVKSTFIFGRRLGFADALRPVSRMLSACNRTRAPDRPPRSPRRSRGRIAVRWTNPRDVTGLCFGSAQKAYGPSRQKTRAWQLRISYSSIYRRLFLPLMATRAN